MRTAIEGVSVGTVNKPYFIDLMQGRRLSLRGLAQRMGMQHSQLSLTLSGQRKMQLDEAAQLSQIFGVPLAEIAINAGVTVRPTAGRRVSVIGFVGQEGVVTMNPPDVIERTDAPGDLPDECAAIQCRTAETPLSWMDGWILFCRQEDRVNPLVMGRFSLAKIKDGPIVTATIKRGYRDGTCNLSGPYQRENVSLEWATPMLVGRF